ncbi:glycosyltransferase family protein [Gulosibacter molinativorax]|uniref:Glycosyltransferase family 1 protein n=1 Tax=Gulosibacter molinativorax TaxID=256821 RepID=A0ABT7C762_9MICO|nr:glycosyltransferase family 4 protein [Gulosibacter molinativorax]MDJ1370948.1 hypothetical protein [Gulosibacter molinativorax]
MKTRAQRYARDAQAGSARALHLLKQRGDLNSHVPEEYWPSPQPDSADPLRTFLPLPPAEGLSEWFFGSATRSNDGGARDSNCIVLFVSVDGSEDAYPVSALARLLASRRGLKDSLHTIVITAPDATRRARAVLRSGRIRTGVSVVEAPDATRLNALFSLTSAMVIPTQVPATELPINKVNSAQFKARAAGVPVAAWPAESPLPAMAHELVVPALAASTRIASRIARFQALEQTVDIPSHRPDVWQEPTHLYHGASTTDRPQRIVVAGHDMKFAHAGIDELRRLGHEVQLDEWTGHARHDEEHSNELLDWADVVWCEWTLGNAAWYSQRMSPGKRLVTRLHLQELSTAFPSTVHWENVDATLVVADHVRRQLLRDSDAAEERTAVMPNMVHIPETVPEHADDARFRLGLAGMVPARKGLREALDVLKALREVDPRYSLSLRGKRPEEYPWMADRTGESEYFDRELARIENDPLLGDAVEFSPFGPDMSSWYQQVGVALSTSEFESFHFTAPDGAAHGAAPFLLSWPGADLLYPAAWLHPDTDGLAKSILETTQDAVTWRTRAAEAREFIADTYSEPRVLDALVSTILGSSAS